MARPKSRTQQPGTLGGTQGGGGNIIYREQPILALGNSIRMLEEETTLQRGMLNNLTQGGTVGRAGTAGGVQAGRTTGEPGGANMAGGLSNPEWLRNVLSQHAEGLTAAQIREIAQQQGRQVHKSFPFDSFGKMRAKKEIKKTGHGVTATWRLTAVGGTGKM